MLIDWFTVIAQALNFLILVWLLKRFLYKPILNAVDAREQKVAEELASADKNRNEAQKERDDFQRKNKELEDQRASIMKKVADDAKAQAEILMVEARQSADTWSKDQMASMKNDVNNLDQSIIHLAQDQVFLIVRKTLGELASVSLEQSISDAFIRRILGMDSKAKESLALALKSETAHVSARSTFDLSDSQRAEIQSAINKLCSSEIALHFETAARLVAGIEITAGGQRVAWSIADYLASMEKNVHEFATGALVAKTADKFKSENLSKEITGEPEPVEAGLKK